MAEAIQAFYFVNDVTRIIDPCCKFARVCQGLWFSGPPGSLLVAHLNSIVPECDNLAHLEGRKVCRVEPKVCVAGRGRIKWTSSKLGCGWHNEDLGPDLFTEGGVDFVLPAVCNVT